MAPVVWVPPGIAWWMAPCGRFGGENVAVDGSGRVPLPPLAGAWWFVGSPAVVALVSSGAEVAGGDADAGVLPAMVCLMRLAWVM